MKKYVFLALFSLMFLVGFAFWQYFYFHDGMLHVVFCDVGQGDGIFIRTPSGKKVLIDGGMDKKILSCLESQMGFWDRNIDLVILTHPHLDHYMGLYYVIDRYNILSFDSEDLENDTGTFRALMNKVRERGIRVRKIFLGDKYQIERNLRIDVLAPDEEFLRRTSHDGMIADSGEFASVISRLNYKEFDVMFTGDSQAEALDGVVVKDNYNLEVLQVPHHGSATGLTKKIVDELLPSIAVISVGENNKYGHPNKKVLSMMGDVGVRVLRTDKVGSIEIVSDGKSWWIK